MTYIYRIYLPMILIVCLSFSTFWIDYRATPARTIMPTVAVLTAVLFITSVQDILPHTSKVKFIDVYMLVSFLFVFMVLVEYAFAQSIEASVKRYEKSSIGTKVSVTVDM